MQIGKIQNPFDLKALQGAQLNPAVGAVKKVGGEEQGSNPFAANIHNGIGIKDGAIQTSNGQMGKEKAQMRQLGIA